MAPPAPAEPAPAIASRRLPPVRIATGPAGFVAGLDMHLHIRAGSVARVVAGPAHGQVVIIGGAVRYVPEPGFSGNDSFAIEHCDSGICTHQEITVAVGAPLETTFASPALRVFTALPPAGMLLLDGTTSPLRAATQPFAIPVATLIGSLALTWVSGFESVIDLVRRILGIR